VTIKRVINAYLLNLKPQQERETQNKLDYLDCNRNFVFTQSLKVRDSSISSVLSRPTDLVMASNTGNSGITGEGGGADRPE